MKFLLTDNSIVELLGDPHLGRKFEHGVPLDRRGQREAKQLLNFTEKLHGTRADYYIMVGDLFDHPHVGYAVVLDTYYAIRSAAQKKPRTIFAFMAGNHDLPRNIKTIGAFDLLATMLEDTENVVVVTSPTVLGDVALFPWEWDRAALDQVEDLKDHTNVGSVVGHWDLKSFGGDDSHLAPTEALLEAFGDDLNIYSGHYHTAGDYKVGNIVVHCTGSMEPYSHAEDPEGTTYVTLTLEELKEVDEGDLKDKCVRVLLEEGEEMPTDLDCMALTGKRVTKESADYSSLDISSFSWKELLDEKLEPLTPVVKEFIYDRLGEDNA
jgi:DNA repair exonuclease SbcCD nuclease subunit